MDTQPVQFDIDQYDAILESTPEPVRNFLWSSEYAEMVSILGQHFSLSEEGREKLSSAIFDILIGYASQENTMTSLGSLGISLEQQAELTAYIFEYFVRPIGVQTELELETTDASQAAAPSPADVLASLKSRLTTPGTIAPVSRELPAGQAAEKAAAAAPQKPNIDPYREIPT